MEAHRDRLIPFAVINPSYAGWRGRPEGVPRELGMRGLRLYPKLARLRASPIASCLDLVDAATEPGWIVSIPIRVEDARQRSWLVDVPDVPLGGRRRAGDALPRARFLLLNGIGLSRVRPWDAREAACRPIT